MIRLRLALQIDKKVYKKIFDVALTNDQLKMAGHRFKFADVEKKGKRLRDFVLRNRKQSVSTYAKFKQKFHPIFIPNVHRFCHSNEGSVEI